MEQNRIAEFYNNSMILLCGATGFVGKVLLEKILRSLQIRRIYILVRRKHNLNAEQRLESLLSEPLFQHVDREKFANCVVPLEVDFDQDDLSMNANDLQSLTDEVEIVFNLIASVKFNEPLDSALKINVEYTQRILRLTTSFKRLRSIIHVSTFYSNCDRPFIEEKIYDDIPFGGYGNIREIVAQLSLAEKEILIPHVLGKLPNSYTFSKKCAELMVRDDFRNLPIGIFRPPIVGSIYRDPIPGWIDNFNGPSGILTALHEGLLRVLPLDTQKKPFLAPVDYCINGMLCCAVDVISVNSEEILVYNFADDRQLYNWGQIFSGLMKGMPPLRRFFNGYVLLMLTTNPVLYFIGKQLTRLQGWLVGAVNSAFGHKHQIEHTVERVITQVESMKYFCQNDWQMENSNMKRVVGSLNPTEAFVFPCDLEDVDWPTYWKTFIPGVLEYALKPRLSRAGKK